MVEIKQVDENISLTDIGTIADLYFDSFRYKILDIGPEKMKERLPAKMLTSAKNGELIVAYEDSSVVGFLLAKPIDPANLVLMDYATKLAKAPPDETEYYSQTVRYVLGAHLSLISSRDLNLSEMELAKLSLGREIHTVRPTDLMKRATAVLPDYRRKGIATTLNEKLEETAESEGRKQIFTTCNTDVDITETNSSLRYIPFLVVRPWYKDRSSGLFMVKDLT